jgi:hypothetical protein
LGDVRLGRRARVGVRGQGARPGIRHPDGRQAVGRRGVHRPTPEGVRGGQAAEGAPLRHGAPHPALGDRPQRSTWRRTTRSRSRSPVRASCS